MLIDSLGKYRSTEDEYNYRIVTSEDVYYLNMPSSVKLVQSVYDNLDEDFTLEERYDTGKVQPVLCVNLGDKKDTETIADAIHSCQQAIKSTIVLSDVEGDLTCASYYLDDKLWVRFTEFIVNYTTLLNKVLPAAKSLCSSVCSSFSSSLVPLPLSIGDFNVTSVTSDVSIIEWLDRKSEIKEDEAVALILSKFHSFGPLYPSSGKSTSPPVPGEKKETKADFNKRLKTNISIKSVADKIKEPLEEPINILPDLFNMYNYSRVKTETTWREIGKALHRTFTDEKRTDEEAEDHLEEGYKLWELCTERLDNVDDDRAIYSKRMKNMRSEWDTFDVIEEYDDMFNHPSNNLNFSTLKFWAYIDSTLEYEKYTYKTLRLWLYRSLNFNAADTEIADVIRYKYGMKYKVAALEPKIIWYEFKRHRWVVVQKATSLRRHMSEDITNLYENLQTEINKKLKDHMTDLKKNADDEEMNIVVERCKQMLLRCGTIIKALKTQAAKNTILNELSETLYDDEFQQVRDENPYLICHKNGVYDLKKQYLREGRPNDCITLSTGINFVKPSSDHVAMVNDYMAQVFVDESLREYVWMVTSTYLEGYNFMKALYVLIGAGNNSKSAFVNLLERVLGEYVFKLPIGILTSELGNYEGPSPALARGKGRRLGVFDELNKDGRIKDGPAKRITGNIDKQIARNLYEAPFEYRPQFKCLLVTNNRIKVTSDQPALLDRINEIVFDSKFSKACPPTVEEQVAKKHFPVDISFDKKFPQMAEAFLYILTKTYYRKFKEHGITEPRCIRKHREKMLLTCDVFKQFKEEMMEESEDDSVSFREAYSCFKDWFREEHGKGDPPNKQDFVDMLSKRLRTDPDEESRSWSGFSMKTVTVDRKIRYDDY